MTYGPFMPNVAAGDRCTQLAELRALVKVLAGPYGEAARGALTAALKSPTDPAALTHAQAEIDQLPSRPRRRVLASFAALQRADRP